MSDTLDADGMKTLAKCRRMLASARLVGRTGYHASACSLSYRAAFLAMRGLIVAHNPHLHHTLPYETLDTLDYVHTHLLDTGILDRAEYRPTLENLLLVRQLAEMTASELDHNVAVRVLAMTEDFLDDIEAILLQRQPPLSEVITLQNVRRKAPAAPTADEQPTPSPDASPSGRRGRPRDPIARAVQVCRIATGEIEDPLIRDKDSAAAVRLGGLGGRARKRNLTPERRTEIARGAAETRWRKDR